MAEDPRTPLTLPGLCPEQRADVVVVGGGMAGIWVAYQLAKTGLQTTIVTYREENRGGAQGASRRSAGAFNTFILDLENCEHYLHELGLGQMHPSVCAALKGYLRTGIEELRALMDLKTVKIGLALGAGSGEEFLNTIGGRFAALGGRTVNGWVTRLLADETSCRGVQYESPDGVGKIRARAIVLASGGYAGLFGNAIKTNCYGNILGSYLLAGGIATNLEFLFKHGYGNVDANALTPTEELPGAEIYDHHHQRATWLEELLFYKQGTKTHLQAVQFWLRNPEREFYVDLSYRPLYQKIWRLNDTIAGNPDLPAGATHQQLVEDIVSVFEPDRREAARERLAIWINERRTIGHSMFEELKGFSEPVERSRFRVRPLTYFSMGGMGHVDFATNLKNVFVTGEAMHDFGANRVGGLPWSLYLTSGYVIAREVQRRFNEEDVPAGEDFEVLNRHSHFDSSLLQAIQQRMYDCHDRELTSTRATESVVWFRAARRNLAEQTDRLHDGVSWLLVAEAIMQSSLCRHESRGFFFRFDYQAPDSKLENLFSRAWYDPESDTIQARLSTWKEIAAQVRKSEPFPPPNIKHGPLLQRC
jgi:fatty acid CoA ligase FadD22